MRKIFSLVIILSFTILYTYPVEAHFLAVDNNIGAELHVDPYDEPVVGEQAAFLFEFKDKQNKFQQKSCDCIFSIVESGKEIFSQPLSTASIFYTFPQRDIYQVKVVGKPLTHNVFQSFTLTWEFRVDKQAHGQPSFFATHIVHFIGAGVLFILLLSYIVYNHICRKNSLARGSNKKNDTENNNPVY